MQLKVPVAAAALDRAEQEQPARQVSKPSVMASNQGTSSVMVKRDV